MKSFCLLVVVALAQATSTSSKKMCELQCTPADSWVVELVNEQYRIVFDRPSSTLTAVDMTRKLALSVNRFDDVYALVNLDNGWVLYGSKETAFAGIPDNKMPNPMYLMSNNATERSIASAFLKEATSRVKPLLPVDYDEMHANKRMIDMDYYIRALQSGNLATFFKRYSRYNQLAKVNAYQNIQNNTGDLFRDVQNLRFKTRTCLDFPRGLFSRMPEVFAYALSRMFYELTGTNAGFLDGTQLQTQTVSLLQMIPGDSEIEFIDTSADRTWTVHKRNGEIFYITSTGLVYDEAGNLVESVTISQTGNVIGLPIYDSTKLKTTFPGTATNNNNNGINFLNPLTSIFNMFGNALNFNI